MTDQDEKVITKIKKLLNIAANDSASDGDIQAAMNAVHALMDRHHLTEDDLAHEPLDDYKKVDQAEKGLYRAWVGAKIYAWESYLANFVSNFVGVPVYIDNAVDFVRERGIIKRPLREGKSVVFYGVAEDAQIAKELYDELRFMISTLAQAKYDCVYIRDGGRYCQGFVSGLHSQLRKSTDQQKLLAQQNGNSTGLLVIERRNALVEYKNIAAKDWLKAEHGWEIKR